ncbi:MAG TPA: YeeE/YedE thiosulfate transporter family protein [Gemmatimonadales bacterium]|nr:YeeE/YedE thiosulfate transporter family protein [Gemmatimonadales bacterium]
MTELLHKPWPWYVTGPLVGLVAVGLLAIGNKQLGVSSNLRHLCAALAPREVAFFKYDWRGAGLWNLVFILGVVVGGFVGGVLLANVQPVAITPAAHASLAPLGIRDFAGLVPRDFFNWHALLTVKGFLMIVGGGFLIGFGTAYGGGCTAGHGITGLADLQLASLIAVISFFAAGAAASFLVLPLLVPR